MRLEARRLPLTTKRPFVIARGTSRRVDNLVARLDLGDAVGYGEAAPAPGVTGERLEDAALALATFATHADRLAPLLEQWAHVPGGDSRPAARSALVVAHLDALGRRAGQPLRRLLNLPEGRVATSVTLSLGTPEAVLGEAALYEAAGWPLWKLKLGGVHDEAVVRALRDRYPEKPLRVDANEAWSPAVARDRFAFLARHDVEFVEQPLPRDRLEESAALARDFDLPLVLDESLHDSDSALELVRREAGDGANIKLAKCGGPYEARRIVKVLRDAGWKVMMGCMLESRLGIAAAAAFAGVLDWADLDGHELVADDPFTGFETPGGWVETPEGAGVGVELRAGETLPAAP